MEKKQPLSLVKNTEEVPNIKLDQMDILFVLGLQAREREIGELNRRNIDGLTRDVNIFLASLQDKFEVKLNVTHTIDWQKCELQPIKTEPTEEIEAEITGVPQDV